MEFLKPLLSWKKYLLANKLLKIAVNNYAIMAGVNDSQTHMKTYAYYHLKNQFVLNPKTKPDRLLEAVDLLAENKHVLKFDNVDLYKVFIQCTTDGERALNDGYYTKILIKKAAWIFGTPIALFLLRALAQKLGWSLP